jgi:hypothetical protein
MRNVMLRMRGNRANVVTVVNEHGDECRTWRCYSTGTRNSAARALPRVWGASPRKPACLALDCGGYQQADRSVGCASCDTTAPFLRLEDSLSRMAVPASPGGASLRRAGFRLCSAVQ